MHSRLEFEINFHYDGLEILTRIRIFTAMNAHEIINYDGLMLLLSGMCPMARMRSQ